MLIALNEPLGLWTIEEEMGLAKRVVQNQLMRAIDIGQIVSSRPKWYRNGATLSLNPKCGVVRELRSFLRKAGREYGLPENLRCNDRIERKIVTCHEAEFDKWFGRSYSHYETVLLSAIYGKVTATAISALTAVSSGSAVSQFWHSFRNPLIVRFSEFNAKPCYYGLRGDFPALKEFKVLAKAIRKLDSNIDGHVKNLPQHFAIFKGARRRS